eukprot:TCALIF_09756-PA protein Name:"Similar to Tret1-2 Facilitated trehalose transporter Tret1-2 homolog (Drosophila sechellia)" AED:0.35 eAED:0.38 QI:0/1/0.5/1/0.33/0.5/4/0/556
MSVVTMSERDLESEQEVPDAPIGLSVPPLEQLAPYSPWETSTAFSKRRQTLAVFIVTIASILNGTSIGYSGPAVPLLLNPVSTNIYGGFLTLDVQDVSWITAIMSLGCFFGCIVSGPIMDKIGRKPTLMLVTTGLFVLGYLLIFLAPNIGTLLAGRFFTGSGLGFAIASSTVYLVEVTSSDMRGVLGCFVQLQGTLGVLFTFAMGTFLDWYFLALANLCFVAPLVIGMLFVPETPRWLILQGQDEEAKASLLYRTSALAVQLGMLFVPETPRWLILQGQDEEAKASLEWFRGRENQELIFLEIENIKCGIEFGQMTRVTLADLKEAWKPSAICLGLMFLAQFCGLSTLVFYTVSIFQLARSSLDPRVASVLVGITLFLSSCLTLIVVPKFNRRLILLISILGMTLGMIVLGICLHFIEQTPPDQPLTSVLKWLPVTTVILALFIGNGGFGTLVWIVMAEILPPKVRSLVTSLSICFGFLMGFVVSKTFVDLAEAINISGTFWLYGVINFLSMIVLGWVLPETRNRTIEQIQKKFTRSYTKFMVPHQEDYEELVSYS